MLFLRQEILSFVQPITLVVYQLEFAVPMNLDSNVKLFCIQMKLCISFMDMSTSVASKIYCELVISRFFISLVTNFSISVDNQASVSSLEVGVVAESTISSVSISHSRTKKGTIDLFAGPPIQMPSHLTPMDKEARFLRYMEKKEDQKI